MMLVVRGISLFLGLSFLLGNIWFLEYSSGWAIWFAMVWVLSTLMPVSSFEKPVYLIVILSAVIASCVSIIQLSDVNDIIPKIVASGLGLIYLIIHFIFGAKALLSRIM